LAIVDCVMPEDPGTDLKRETVFTALSAKGARHS